MSPNQCGPRATEAQPWLDAPMLLTASEVALLLRTSRPAVYAMAERGQLPGVIRVGRRLLVHRVDLLDWLDHSRTPSREE